MKRYKKIAKVFRVSWLLTSEQVYLLGIYLWQLGRWWECRWTCYLWHLLPPCFFTSYLKVKDQSSSANQKVCIKVSRDFPHFIFLFHQISQLLPQTFRVTQVIMILVTEQNNGYEKEGIQWCRLRRMLHRKLYINISGWMDGWKSPGEVRYRAPYEANNREKWKIVKNC